MNIRAIYKMLAIGLMLFMFINTASASDKSIRINEEAKRNIQAINPGQPIVSELRVDILNEMQKLITLSQKASSNIRRKIKELMARENKRIKRTDIIPFLDLANKYDEFALLVERKMNALGESYRVCTKDDLKLLKDMAKDLEDDQSKLQFEIQMATSELQNAASVRSQAEKRLEQTREGIMRNWTG